MATADGVQLEAAAVVFATGYELAKGVPSQGHRRTSTWAFATRPQPNALWSKGELIWEASKPYLYIRSTTDGRVVVGGEDEDCDDAAARDALLPRKTAALQKKTSQLMPWLDVSAEYAWAGTFGESDSGLPSIGRIPGMANCYAVLGYGGNGLTFGVIAVRSWPVSSASGLIRTPPCSPSQAEEGNRGTKPVRARVDVIQGTIRHAPPLPQPISEPMLVVALWRSR